MNLIRSVELMKKYAVCPECGNDKIGGGAGEIEIANDIFRRTCQCGWSVEERGRPEAIESSEITQASAGGRIGLDTPKEESK